MSDLACMARACVNNSDGLCCLPAIHVDGETAEKEEGTCCDNFRVSDGFLNSAATADKKTDICCTAERCAYNHQQHCCADHVEICTCQRPNGQESMRGTFKR